MAKKRKGFPLCRRCRKGPQVAGRLCGFCYAADVLKFEERAPKSKIVVRKALGSLKARGLMLVRRKDWDALVLFFRGEEKILQDSHGTPRKKYKDWERWFKAQHRADWVVYDAARKAAESQQ